MNNPFTFDELCYLLEYLDGHAATPQSTYSLQISGFIRDNESIDINDTCISNITVRGLRSIQRISKRPGVLLEHISWSNLDSTVTFDCTNRELHIKTGSISFIEVCRHKLSRQSVSKIIVDLKPR